MAGTAWQDAEVARRFVEERRGGVPYGPDQIEMMLHLVRQFRPEPRRYRPDFGCRLWFAAPFLSR